jgi:hypothetical protein
LSAAAINLIEFSILRAGFALVPILVVALFAAIAQIAAAGCSKNK